MKILKSGYMSLWTKTAIILSLIGGVLVSGLCPLYGNIIWLFADGIWTVHFYKIKEWDAFIMFYSYFFIAWYGVCNWWGIVV